MSDKPLPTFASCFTSALNFDLGSWSLLAASIIIVYGYILSNKKFLWQILLVNGISGTLGIIIQTSFLAVHWDPNSTHPNLLRCNDIAPTGSTVRDVLNVFLGINEMFWYLNEITIVLYSFFKIETVTSVTIPRRYGLVLRAVMLVFVIAYLPLRIVIGIIRRRDDARWNDAIADAHAYAFSSWGFVELIIIGMLIQAAVYAKRESQNASNIITTIFSSSILRLLIISVNQIAIAIATRFKSTESLEDFKNCLWLIRGAYPMIMLFDILSTQTLLVERSRNNSNRRSNFQTYDLDVDVPTQPSVIALPSISSPQSPHFEYNPKTHIMLGPKSQTSSINAW
ncbi:hypothetical protein HK098_005840 [Nowakowskiella sp. JEL0407]|nr:hypothetical protein HK098_005840 [Nowakowskiella sp. JEL0407]